MNDLNFTFEESIWEQTLAQMNRGDTLSAVRFLTIMEQEEEDAVMDALVDLDAMGITLDVSDLPKAGGTGEAALRLRREEELAKQGSFLGALERNDPLRLYLEELEELPKVEEPQTLAEKSLAGNSRAGEQLATGRLYRVVELAGEMVGRGVLLLDLIQEGSLGLWQSIGCYEGGDFAAHSDWWIRNAMAKAVTIQARSSGVGQKMRQAMEDYRAVDERLLCELGRNATLEEIAEQLHMTAEETMAVARMISNARLVDKAKPSQEPEEEDIEEERHVEDTAFFQMRQRILDLLSCLSEEDAKLLTLRFGLEGGMPLNPEDAGRKLGLTPEEVVTREAKALAQLRNS